MPVNVRHFILIFPAVLLLFLCLFKPTDSLYPWEAVGGCGVGGSGSAGGGATGGLKWIGRGATGGLMDAELLFNVSTGEKFIASTGSISLMYPFLHTNTFGFAMPLTYKNGEYRLSDAYVSDYYEKISSGDISLTYSRKFGSANQSVLSIGYGLPLSTHDVRVINTRLQEPPNQPLKRYEYLPPDLQAGNGLHSLSLVYNRTVDKDWGTIDFSIGYSQVFESWNRFFKSVKDGGAQNKLWKTPKEQASDIETGEVTYETTYQSWYNAPLPWDDPSIPIDEWGNRLLQLQSPVTVRRSIRMRFPDGGKGSVIDGDFTGNSVSATFAAALRTEKLVHSIQTSYSFKLKADWFMRRPDADYLNHRDSIIDSQTEIYYLLPVFRENARHVWSLGYGMEVSNIYMPIFTGLSVVVDGRAQFQSVNFTVGFKSSLF